MLVTVGLGITAAEMVGRTFFDCVEAAVPHGVGEIHPRTLRRLLLTFESSIHGRIPEILGDDDEERVETLVSLLRGSSEEDLTTLLEAAHVALTRLEAPRGRSRPPRPPRRRAAQARSRTRR